VNFSSIIGQKEVIGSLQNLILNDRVGHAFIFSGPGGIGKATVAAIFASILLCEKGSPYASCGDCPSCLMFENNTNPDYHTLEPGDSSIGVDEIRELERDIIIRPLYSRRKVYIIFEADKMTVQAQNCLLKTLEEPPRYSVIILLTSNYDALLETIRSRTVKFNFKKNTQEEVKKLLSSQYSNLNMNTDFIASYSDGVIGRALEFVESNDFGSLRNNIINMLLKLSKSRLVDIFDIYDIFDKNKTSINSILDIMLLFYRDILVARSSGKENMLINSDKKDIILNSVDGFSPQKLMKNIETIETTRKNIKSNANYQLSIEVMLMALQEEDF
jgi:DNA polymerase III subunit delta'